MIELLQNANYSCKLKKAAHAGPHDTTSPFDYYTSGTTELMGNFAISATSPRHSLTTSHLKTATLLSDTFKWFVKSSRGDAMVRKTRGIFLSRRS
jgi:hypothetical protein